jgi:hypothetical protein
MIDLEVFDRTRAHDGRRTGLTGQGTDGARSIGLPLLW